MDFDRGCIHLGRDWVTHLHHLALTFERLQQHRLHCAPAKCRFEARELKYLGHIVSAQGNRSRPVRQEARQSIGLCNWPRECIQDFGRLAAPLTDILSPQESFAGRPKQIRPFAHTKEAIPQPLALHRPDADIPFVVQTDSSGVGIAAVLCQETQDQRRIISYASARLTPPQRRYHVNKHGTARTSRTGLLHSGRIVRPSFGTTVSGSLFWLHIDLSPIGRTTSSLS